MPLQSLVSEVLSWGLGPTLVNTDDGNNDTGIFKNIYSNSKFGTEGPKLIGQVTVVPRDISGAIANLSSQNSKSAILSVCPMAFEDYASISDLVKDQVTKDRTCAYFNDYVSTRMDNLATTFLHEYIHFSALVSPPLIFDVPDHIQSGTGPYKAQHINKMTALYNPESYAWYATEVFWTIYCGRQFLPPPSEAYDRLYPANIPTPTPTPTPAPGMFHK